MPPGLGVFPALFVFIIRKEPSTLSRQLLTLHAPRDTLLLDATQIRARTSNDSFGDLSYLPIS